MSSRKRLLGGNRKLFLSYFFSYFIFASFFLFLAAVPLSYFLKAIKDTEENRHLSSLEYFREIMDGAFKDINNCIDFIAWDIDITKMINSPPSQRLNSADAENKIKVLSNMNSIIKRVYVCGIYSGSGIKIFPEDYFSMKIEWSDILKEENLKVNSSKEFIKLAEYYNEAVKDFLFIIKPFPLLSPNVENGYIIIVLNSMELQYKINQIKKLTGGRIILLNSDNRIIAFSDERNYPDYDIYEMMSKLKGNDEIEKQGDYFTSYVESEIADCRYLSVIPSKIYRDEAGYWRLWISLLTASYIALTLAGSYFFAEKNTRPLTAIKEMIKTGDFSGNFLFPEYDFIYKDIKAIYEENRANSEKIFDLRKMMDVFYLSNLISGKYSFIEKEKFFGERDFIGERFVVAVCRLNVSAEDADHLLLDFPKKLFSEERLTYAAEIGGFFAFLFNYSDKLTDAEISGFVKNDPLFLMDNLPGCRAGGFISVSSVKRGISEIRNAFDEAAAAMDCEILKGSGEIIRSPEAEALSEKESGAKQISYGSFRSMQEKYFNFMNAGLYEAAGALIDIEADKIIKSDSSIALKKQMLSSFISLLLISLSELPPELTDDLRHGEEKFPDFILKCRTFPDFMAVAGDIFGALISKQENGCSNSTIGGYCKEYIKKNYWDRDLSVSSIADKAGITMQYLSNLFKEQTGCNILTYLNKVRRDKAKELLRGTELSIKDIAEKVGYYTDIGFIRAFKRYEGISPGKYRQIKNKREKK